MPARLASAEIFQRLIGFDTVSSKSNLEFIDWTADYLETCGATVRLTHNPARSKANLFAELAGYEPHHEPSAQAGRRSGIILSGHSDVVPVDGQTWQSDPFTLTRREDRFFGRGSADMKGFIAAALGCAPLLQDRRLGEPIYLALSFDEEVGCLGVPYLIEDLARLEHRPRACIVGEPTEMRLVNGHKGKVSVACEVKGHSCHSALAPYGVNAVEAAAEAIAYLKTLMRQHRSDGPFDLAYDPPYTTIHTGTIEGGTALNIVPARCRFEFECRTLPSEDPHNIIAEFIDYCRQTLEPAMHDIAGDSGFRFDELSFGPGLSTDENSEIVQFVKALTGHNEVAKIAFGTEAGLFQNADIDTIVIGPGSIEQAHKPDEFISEEQFFRGEAFLHKLIDRVSL